MGGIKRSTGRWFGFQVRARRLFNRIPLKEHQKIYVLTLLIGALCGLAAVLFHLLLDFFQEHIIYAAAGIQHWWMVPLVLLIPAAGGLIAGAGLYFYAPEARGSGIPQVKTAFYLDGGRIPARVIPGKMLLSSLNIGTGASLGREGPTVQICAGIASLLGRIFAISRRRLQSLVPVGAAAGLAAAFNTPIASVTFTLEEILGDTSGKPLGSIVIAAVIAAVIERSILGEHALFSVPAYRLNNALELIFYALLGLLAGLAAIVFNEGLLRLRAAFRRQRLMPQWATPGVGGLLLGLIALAALISTGSSSIFGVGYGQLAVELQGGLPLKILIILGVCKLAGTVVSYSSGSSGGIFGPSLYIGGMLGGAVGLVAHAVLGNNPQTHAGAFALVGMGAVFAGIVRAPVTSIIIIFEMTNNYSIILPLMVANITSYALATRLSPVPIYDALLLQDGIHLPHTQRHALRQIPVRAAMTRDVVTVRSDMKVSEAFGYVKSLPRHYHSYPVVDGAGALTGLFTFNDLKRALAAGKGKKAIVEIAGRKLVHAHPDHTLDSVIVKLGQKGVSQLPVVGRRDVTRLLGIITMHDVAAALAREDDGAGAEEEEAAEAVPDGEDELTGRTN
ncbi:MAG TPA: chloride channel protein, partial [Pyrinomonadaceae bacterium]|nr:chloride channel protein [Pyrinomonadaceae bacterium]